MFSKRFRLIVVCIVVLSIGFFGYRWIAQRQFFGPIKPYCASRDKAALQKVFDENVFWLTDNPDFVAAHKNFEYQINTSSSSKNIRHKNNLTTFVYCDNGKTTGFVSYYLVSPTRGKILYIAVGKDYRRKRHADTLLTYAVEQLEKQGVKTIELITRIVNRRAQALYTKLGFKLTWAEDGDLVKFERVLK